MNRFLRSVSCVLVMSVGALASQPSLHELLSTLASRRTTAEEALRQTVRSCPAGSPKLKEAQRRYRIARESSNGFLDQLILDLGQDDLRREKVYRARLEASQKSVDELIGYLDGADCQGQGQAKIVPLVLAVAAKLPGFIGWMGDWIGQRKEEARVRREALMEQLREMRWHSFDQVARSAEAPAPPAPAPPPVVNVTVNVPATPVQVVAVPGVVGPASGGRETPESTLALPASLKVTPVLRLETGLHTAAIRALSFSGDGRMVLTASEDKTARLWEMPTGRLLRTIRPTVEAGKVGMLYAAALSPDGQVAALGGWTRGHRDGGHRILLVDTRTGSYLRILDVGPQVVNFLAFSPDGQRLAAHLGGTLGLRLLRVSDGALLGQDLDFTQPSYRGAFDATGRYAATGDDGFLRLYGADFKLLKRVKASEPGPFGIAFSPDGSQVAVAYADSPKVEVRAASDLSLAFLPEAGTRKLGLVAWSRDGQTLLAAGGEDFGPSRNVLRRWARGGRGPAAETDLSRATVSELVPLAAGEVAYAAQDPAWGVVDVQGQPRLTQAIQQGDLRAAREAYGLDAKALVVPLAQRLPGSRGLAFSVAELGLTQASAMVAPPLEAAGLRVEGWKDGEHPALNGRPLVLEPAETSRSLSVAPDGTSFLLGTDWYLRAYTAQGMERWKVPAPAAVWGVAQREDGRVAVALLADGTFRWYRTSDGQELLSLFVAADQRWVLWTPSGCFCTSLGGEGLVGWQVNRVNQSADYFPLSHFRERFWKPELMPLLLDTLDEAAALQKIQPGQGGAQAQVTVLPGMDELPPVLRILSPAEGESVPGHRTTFQVSVRTYGPAKPVQGFRVFLDGARVPPSRGIRPQQAKETSEGVDRTYPVPVDLPPRSVTVGIQAELEGGQLSELAERVVAGVPPPEPAPMPAPAPVSAPVSAPAPQVVPPTLRVLAVGVTQYASPKYNLQFPAKDATDISREFLHQEGKLFGKVEVKLLINDQATEKNILQAMDDLAASSGPGTVTLYFFSSHGGTNAEKSSYFLVPYDFSQGSWGVDGRAIKERLEATQGRTLMLMDTCHSGNVLGEGRMRSLDEAMKRIRFINELIQSGPGTVVFSSSTGAQTSLESPVWNNGAFTKALREGLAGAADPQHTGRITTSSLEAYVRRRVDELTAGRQTPVAAASESTRGFPVAVD
ncbi:MAG: caspase family protein [Geothrix sp.]|nr:caspase family protein [Geothrix sp.]